MDKPEGYDKWLEDEYLEEILEALDEEDSWVIRMINDSVQEAADGCRVEPDGMCPHGYVSPARLLGVV